MSTRRFGGEVYRGRRGSRMRGFAVSGSRAWRPTDIAGCTLWLDPSDPDTLTQSAGRVTEWRDKSANGYALTATDGARPYSQITTINNLVALVNGSARIYKANAPINNASNGEVTVLAVVKNSKPVSGGSAYQNFLSMDSGLPHRVALAMMFGSGYYRTWAWTSDDVLRQGADMGYTTTSPVLFTTRMWAGYADIQMNTWARAQATSLNPQPKYSASAALNIFAKYTNDSTDLFEGAAGEIVAYSSKLSDADLATVRNYMAAKWGIWTTLAHDTFTRANAATLGTTESGGLSWVPRPGTEWSVSSNQATCTVASTTAHSAVLTDPGRSDYSVEVRHVINGGDPCLVFRANSDYSGYFLAWRRNTGKFYLGRWSGTWTELDQTPNTWSDGDVVQAVLSGTSIVLKKNGSTVLTTTSSECLTQTACGMIDGWQTRWSTWDDFMVTST